MLVRMMMTMMSFQRNVGLNDYDVFFLVCLKFETPPPLTQMDLKITRTSREQLIQIKCKGLQLASVVIPTTLYDDNTFQFKPKMHRAVSFLGIVQYW